MKRVKVAGKGFSPANDYLTIAFPKGRIFDEAGALFKKVGIDCSEAAEDSRRLIF